MKPLLTMKFRTVAEIARDLGVCKVTVYRRLKGVLATVREDDRRGLGPGPRPLTYALPREVASRPLKYGVIRHG